MNFDQPINKNNLTRNIVLKCALPVVLLAMLAIFVTCWKEQAHAIAVVTGMFLLKWTCLLFDLVVPYCQALANSTAWKFLSEYLLQPLSYVMLPVAIFATSLFLMVGCVLNKMKSAGYVGKIYEQLASKYKFLAWLFVAVLTAGYLVEVDRAEQLIVNVLTLWACSALALISSHFVEKVNGDLFKWGRK